MIAIEGPEGAGKSTQRELMANYLRELGHTVTLTREPGGTPLAERVRELLLTPNDENWCNDAELLLFFAARAQHMAEVIMPCLMKGHIVICDRFVDTTYAYQQYGRQGDRSRIKALEDFTLKGFVPDKTFLFQINVNTGMTRASARGSLDRMEREGMDFFERVAEGYEAQRAANPHRYFCVDGTPSADAVFESMLPELRRTSILCKTRKDNVSQTSAGTATIRTQPVATGQMTQAELEEWTLGKDFPVMDVYFYEPSAKEREIVEKSLVKNLTPDGSDFTPGPSFNLLDPK